LGSLIGLAQSRAGDEGGARAAETMSPAAGGFRRVDELPHRGRSASPPRLAGCAPWIDDLPATHALEVDGVAIGRRLRGLSPVSPLSEGMKGSIVLGATPRPYHTEERCCFTFDAPPDLGGTRTRTVRRTAAARNLSPTWTMGESFPPEAAQASFPSQRRNLSPDQSMLGPGLAGLTGVWGEKPVSRRMKGAPRKYQLGGTDPEPKIAKQQAVMPISAPTIRKPLAPRQSNEDAAKVMENSIPILWPGEVPFIPDPAEERWSPISCSANAISRVGEFSPSSRSREVTRDRAGSPRPVSPGIPGTLSRKGLCSPRDDKSTFLLENPDYSGIKRGKLRVATAPATGGVSAALQWRG